MKYIYIILLLVGIACFGGSEGSFVALMIFALFCSALMKSIEKISKDVKDLKKYNDINDVIKKFGVPDNMQEFGEYKKYIFKKSTNGWGSHKYKVDVFTQQNDKLVKHESFYE